MGWWQMYVQNVEENKIINPFKDVGDGFGFEYGDQGICGCALNVAGQIKSFHHAMVNIYTTTPHRCNIDLVSWKQWRVIVC